jgi:hypothetical protein
MAMVSAWKKDPGFREAAPPQKNHWLRFNITSAQGGGVYSPGGSQLFS